MEVHDLTVAYHKKPVRWGIDLVVPPGRLVGIVGPNGAGKSTLIKAAMGLLPLSSGWVKIFGQPVEKNLVRVGYVPQRESVDWDFPVKVMDVVLMGRYGRLGLIRRPSKADREVARACDARDCGQIPGDLAAEPQQVETGGHHNGAVDAREIGDQVCRFEQRLIQVNQLPGVAVFVLIPANYLSCSRSLMHSGEFVHDAGGERHDAPPWFLVDEWVLELYVAPRRQAPGLRGAPAR